MTLEQLLWLSSRVAALTAFFVLAAGLVTGQALRSAMFEGAMRNRELSDLHRFLTICWVPFVLLHVLTMTIDGVARVSPVDLVIPFRVAYAANDFVLKQGGSSRGKYPLASRFFRLG